MASGTSGMSQKISELTERLENSCLGVEKMREDHVEIGSMILERRKEKIELEHQVEENRVHWRTKYLTERSEKLEEIRMFLDLLNPYLFDSFILRT